jgi:hypothetical protein
VAAEVVSGVLSPRVLLQSAVGPTWAWKLSDSASPRMWHVLLLHSIGDCGIRVLCSRLGSPLHLLPGWQPPVRYQPNTPLPEATTCCHLFTRAIRPPTPGCRAAQEWATLQQRLSAAGTAPPGWLQNHIPPHMQGLQYSQMDEMMVRPPPGAPGCR